MIRLRPILAFIATSLLITPAGRAFAGDETLAESLFQDGLRLMQEGKYDEACKALDRSVELAGGNAIGGLLVLGECREKQGRPASAWGTYKRAYAAAHKEGDARESKAADAIARLEPTLPKLIVHVAPELLDQKGLEVRRGDQPLPREAWERPLPVDPGTVTVVATVPNMDPFKIDVRVEAAPQTFEANITPWGCLATHDCAKRTTTKPTQTPAPYQPAPLLTPLGITGLVSACAGAIALGVGIGVGVDAKQAYDDAIADPENECLDGACNDKGKTATDGARSQGDIGTAVSVAGAVLLGAGVVLIIVDLAARPSAPEKTRTGLALGLGRAAVFTRW